MDILSNPIDYRQPGFAAGYTELTFWSAPFGLLLFKHLPLRGARGSSSAPGPRIFDLGCATGFPLFELANVYGPGSRVTGLDVWGAALLQAKKHQQVYQFPNTALVHGDGADLPFAPGRFDLVVSSLGVNNFADPARVLAGCARVLAPGGRLALTTNLSGHMREFYAAYRQVLAELGHPEALARLTAQEAHRGTRESLAALVAGVGLRVGKAVEETLVMRYLDGSALLRHSLTRTGFLDGWRSVLDPADEAAVFAAVEERLNSLARAQGELRMTVPMLYLEAEK